MATHNWIHFMEEKKKFDMKRTPTQFPLLEATLKCRLTCLVRVRCIATWVCHAHPIIKSFSDMNIYLPPTGQSSLLSLDRSLVSDRCGCVYRPVIVTLYEMH